jgi:heme exporter protein C
MNKLLPLVCLALAAVGLLVVPHLILAAPNEETMGLVQKIFYFHVPCAWLMFLSTFVAAGGALAFLLKRSEGGEEIAVAASEMVLVFGAIVLISGPLWARKAWGVWWQWDVRLTTSLLLWLIFVGAALVRRYGGPGSQTLASVLVIFGAADVPLIYISVSIWRTIHPKTSVVSTLDPAMRPAFWTAFAVFTLLWVPLFVIRRRLEQNRGRLAAMQARLDDLEEA